MTESSESLLGTGEQSDEPNVGWSGKNKFELTSRHVLNVNTCTDWKKKKKKILQSKLS